MFMAGTIQKTYIRQWRQHRRLTQERLAERLGINHGTLSKIERGLRPYNQPLLEAITRELGLSSPADLIMRDPSDPEGIWSIWDTLTAPERVQAVAVLQAIRKTGGR